MREGGRGAAAIEVLAEIFGRHRPASEALKDWGRAHRFAGAGDRHAIGTLVYDVLRRKSSLAHRMGADAPRALVLAALGEIWKRSPEEIAHAFAEEHGPGALTGDETQALTRETSADAPAHIAGDYPDWLSSSFARAFGEMAAQQGRALAERAPIDLRANILKADRPKVLKALEKFNAVAGPLSPWCVRLAAPGPDKRNPHVEAEPAHGKGWYEVQDAASQVAALLSGARPGEQVADICAGAGGKTLALAALMGNKGQIHAYDQDKHRLRPIFERLTRAGARNVQVIGSDEGARLDTIRGKVDCVVIDAPCSGSGAWRRNPDSKWRLTEKQLGTRMADQRAVLARGAALVKPGGRLIYITCSVLPQENDDQIEAFLSAHSGFESIPLSGQWRSAIGTEPPASAGAGRDTLLLTPLSHQTDGFFIAPLRKQG
ncbi:RsmB/NOP family class I SAM-dependent RNA methyltransferase [Taklimakanibacter lacteus]|uniref:RsmB/NOP family class I SAM-dependent RNA methyltransferase n=1 Tax=Taklimakanibacter lacteus TaxID=2268456 RepID=UPI000E661C57